MTDEIKVLSSHIIDKIAAGEVIERPASIVKELVENSIDANSNNITIEIKNGGTTFIKITDDGKGIEKRQVETAFLRHATSKLKKFEDIGKTLTLGFRGEALSSIASISKVEMITKSANEQHGTKILIEGGKILSSAEYPTITGTSFTIRDIFFNTPVRKKFLKKESVESAYISDIINRFIFGNPQISFKYINNGAEILNTSGNNDLKTSIFYVYGKHVLEKMLEVKAYKDNFTLTGFIGSPEVARGNRSYANLFINGRYVKSKVVQRAVEDAFRGRLMSGKFPIYILNITTPENTVDINVHPTKMEVKFENDSFIFDLVKQSTEKTLKDFYHIPEFSPNIDRPKFLQIPYQAELQKNLKDSFTNHDTNENKTYMYVSEPEIQVLKDPFENLYKSNPNSALEELYMAKKSSNFYHNYKMQNNESQSYNHNFQKSHSTESSAQKATESVFNNYKIIGQVFKTYWLVEKDETMYMIDQHALHEKYLYEKFINSVKDEKVISQVITPCKIDVLEAENIVIKQNLQLLNNFGFKFEQFGQNSYVVREVPFIFNTPLDAEFFLEIVDILKNKSISNIYDLKLDKIASISCKAAIKGNSKISTEEASTMINFVMNLENPFNCPHGRPTIVKFTKYNIEKMFKRVQN